MREGGTTSHGICAVVLIAALLGGLGVAGAGERDAAADEGQSEPQQRARLRPGDTLGPQNWELAKGLLPPEVLKHYRTGEYVSRIYEYPSGRNRWSAAFADSTAANRGRYTLSATDTIIDVKTGTQPSYVYGHPFPDIDPEDPKAAAKILWNYFYTYWNNGNNRDLVEVVWVNPTGIDRRAGQEVRFLYFDGQPRELAPKENPDNVYIKFLATTTFPTDLQGTTALGWRYRDPEKRDSNWAYVPALRRARAVSPANRSDGFLGSDLSQDDGQFFDGKPQDFTWTLVGEGEALSFVDPLRLKDEFTVKELPGGGWRQAYADVPMMGVEDPDFAGIAWAPRAHHLALRRQWIIEGRPKDRYYLYGKLQLHIDQETFEGAWNRKFDWRGELLHSYQVPAGPAQTPDGVLYFSSGIGSGLIWQCAENVKLNRATVSGKPRVEDPPHDRGLPLDPDFFNYQTLARFGK